MLDMSVTAEWDNLDAAFAELEAECADVVRGMSVDIFNTILDWSPQYFGRYVSSWTYSIGAPVFRTDDTYNYVEEDQGFAEIRRKGDSEPIATAKAFNRGRDKAFKLGDTIYIANGADHGEGPYAAGIEDGSIRLRPVNLPGAPATRALDRAGAWYANDVNKTHAAKLKAMSIY